MYQVEVDTLLTGMTSSPSATLAWRYPRFVIRAILAAALVLTGLGMGPAADASPDVAGKPGARIRFVPERDGHAAHWRIDLRRFTERSGRDLLFVSVKRSKADYVCSVGCTVDTPFDPAVVNRPARAAQKYVDGAGGRPCVKVHAAWSRRGGGTVTKVDRWYRACV